MKIYDVTNKETYEVDISSYKATYTGICPACSSERKHKSAKSFSFDVKKGVGKCHNCEHSFVKYQEFTQFQQKEYQKVEYKKPPKFINNTALSDAMVKYFESRKISKQTITEMQITERKEWLPQIEKEANCICFNYFRGFELVNTKFRDGAKHFKLVSGAELIPYNLNGLINETTCIWCEGEFDQLSYYEAGFKNAVSVPNGASKSKQNLIYIDNCFEEINSIQTHYISADNDEAGLSLKDELIRRFGAENCKIIDLKDCKDANEYLVKYGKFSLAECVKNARDVPLSGIYSIDDDIEAIYDLWERGMPQGLRLDHLKLNSYVTWVSGGVAVWTGIPSHGKSEMVDEVCTQLNILHDWKVAYFSPENFPVKLHVSKIASRISGKKFSKEYMPEDELFQTLNYVKENFFFIYPEDDNVTIDSILEHARLLVKKQGIKILVIDPWNRLDHQMLAGQSETAYISKALDKIIIFAQRNDVLVHLVAHPTKMKKDINGKFEVPTLYDIAGSAHFYNKAFYGFCVYRKDDYTELHIQKVKFRHLGQSGTVNFHFNLNNARYVESPDDLVSQPKWNNRSYLFTPPANEPVFTPNKNFYEPTEKQDLDASGNEFPF